jgi:hypothetical protein
MALHQQNRKDSFHYRYQTYGRASYDSKHGDTSIFRRKRILISARKTHLKMVYGSICTGSRELPRSAATQSGFFDALNHYPN